MGKKSKPHSTFILRGFFHQMAEARSSAEKRCEPWAHAAPLLQTLHESTITNREYP